MKKVILFLFLLSLQSVASNLGFIGIGYVGLVSSVGFAELGNRVFCYDIDKKRLKAVQEGKMPFFEPELSELCLKNINKNLFIADDLPSLVEQSDIIFFAVNTPMSENGSADLTYLYNAVAEALKYINKDTIFCIKSTVPVGTCAHVVSMIKEANLAHIVDVVSIPEFLREGSAVFDFFNPHRVVIGFEHEDVKSKILPLYNYYANKNIPIVTTNLNTSECIKYASNAFLATKIAFINEMYQFSMLADTDIKTIAYAMGLDRRIGADFLKHSPGYGGSCFPKDTEALAYFGQQYGADLSIVKTVIASNERHKKVIADKIINFVKTINAENPTVAVLGLAFKANTDDIRYSPSIDIINYLVDAGIHVKAYDPMALENSRAFLNEQCQLVDDAYKAFDNADVVLILTGWEDFKHLNWEEVKDRLHHYYIYDVFNVLNKKVVKKLDYTFIF